MHNITICYLFALAIAAETHSEVQLLSAARSEGLQRKARAEGNAIA